MKTHKRLWCKSGCFICVLTHTFVLITHVLYVLLLANLVHIFLSLKSVKWNLLQFKWTGISRWAHDILNGNFISVSLPSPSSLLWWFCGGVDGLALDFFFSSKLHFSLAWCLLERTEWFFICEQQKWMQCCRCWIVSVLVWPLCKNMSQNTSIR